MTVALGVSRSDSMNTLYRRYVASISACVLSVQAFGDDHAALARLLDDPIEQQHVISGAGHATVFLQNPCADAHFSIEKKLVPYKPLSFDGSGIVASGSWKQIVAENGCGASRILNVMVMVQSAGKLAVIPLLPGSTHAEPLLQQDAAKYAVQALATVPGGREPNCTVGYVADTEFVGQEGQALPGAKGPAWKELWTLQSCTQKMLVPMRFIPDSTGTSISAGPNKAIQIVPIAR
jgi:hypothetical protein